jgi:hypothetical protein
MVIHPQNYYLETCPFKDTKSVVVLLHIFEFQWFFCSLIEALKRFYLFDTEHVQFWQARRNETCPLKDTHLLVALLHLWVSMGAFAVSSKLFKGFSCLTQNMYTFVNNFTSCRTWFLKSNVSCTTTSSYCGCRSNKTP